jgi:protein SCO1/2
MKHTPILTLLLVTLFSFAAWAQGPVTIYKAQGIMSDYDPDAPASNQVTIDCDAIHGFMPAKTLKLAPHDPVDFAKFVPGDILSFQLCVSGSSMWIEQAAKIGTAPNANQYLQAPILRERAAHKQAREQQQIGTPVRQLSPGDLAPDIALIDQSGRTIHVSDLRGNAIAITFMYTSCSVLTDCPMLSQSFARTQDLMTRLGAGDNWRLLSISIDPKHDNSATLASYASALHADPEHWTFATADQKKVREFSGAFGFEFQPTGQTITHNLCTVVIDSTGHIHAIRTGNGWTPQQLASDLRAAMLHNPS